MLEKFFKLKKHNTNIKQEAIGGTVTFLSMAYIIFVNPDILSATGMDKQALITVTCLATIIGTILVGLWANVPFSFAPGMGLNALFAFTLVGDGTNVSWQQGLGVVFMSGLFLVFITFFGLREKIISAIPSSLQVAIGTGIGFFIAFIGLKNMGLIVSNPATLISAGKMTTPLLISLSSLLLTIVMEHYKVKGSILIGILLATALGIMFDANVHLPSSYFSMPPSIEPIAGKMEIYSIFKIVFIIPIFSFIFVNLFDSIGTVIACSMEGNLIEKDGKIPHAKAVLQVDSITTLASGLLGTSSTVPYIESATGIANGARTGLSSIFTAILFVFAMFFAPIIGIVPAYATAPALVIVGIYMAKHLTKINFTELYLAVPSFITIVLMPFTFSISKGIAYGFIMFIILALLTGNYKKIHPIMWFVGIFSIVEVFIG